MPDITFVKPALPRSGALVLLLAEGAALAGLAKAAEEATGGALSRGLEAAKFKGTKGQSCTLWAPGAGLARQMRFMRRVPRMLAATRWLPCSRNGTR
jgi:leucyl aminopeptidase